MAGGAWEKENKEKFWPRARVNEDAPLQWAWLGGACGQAGSSERIQDGQIGPVGAQRKGAVWEGFLEEGTFEHGCACKEHIYKSRKEMAREESLSLDLQRGTVYPEPVCCGPGLGGCRGQMWPCSQAEHGLAGETGSEATGLGAGTERGKGVPRLAGQRKAPAVSEGGQPGQRPQPMQRP